jgi:UDP-N-acetylmuramoyl-tripeptide--D-alanyl-D-alanine ligase
VIKASEIKNYSSFLECTQQLKDNVVTLCTDTRSYDGELIFLAITGERFNGFEFAEQMIAKGCKNIIFTKSKINDELFKGYFQKFPECNFIKVTDSIKFLQEHTRNISDKFIAKGNKLICISGSNGKTTTKEMLYSILDNIVGKTIRTLKNNNNHIGVPLTLLQINEDIKYAVVELGSNRPGEIKTLCNIANPNYGVTTNIGYTHMEFFPTLEDVFKEEGYLFEYMSKHVKHDKKKFFLNRDDQFLSTLNDEAFCISYGENDENNTYHFDIKDSHAKITTEGVSYEIANANITGKHNFYNLCVSIIISHQATGVGFPQILEAAKNFSPTSNRSQWVELESSKVFLDAYNANPSSMRAALQGFRDRVSTLDGSLKNCCVILGDMNELGSNASSFHSELGSEVCDMNFGQSIFVGRFAQDYAHTIENKNNVLCYDAAEKLKNDFRKNIINNFKYVFIKGSRSLQLESLIDIT